MSFPAKKYYYLWGLQNRWEVSQEDLFHAVQNDMLRICIWLPLRYVERCIVKDRKFIFEGFEEKEGFVGIRSTDCHRICNKGSARLRIFTSVRRENHVLRLPYEPPQPSIYVTTGDLVVLHEDLESFESRYNIKPNKNKKAYEEPTFNASKDYKHVVANGKKMALGEVQANIVQLLHDASRSENPWLHSKTLIHESNTKATRMRDIFTRKEHWEYLVLSDKRGYYRLRNTESEKFNEPPADAAIEGSCAAN